jgi:hypothetical protein
MKRIEHNIAIDAEGNRNVGRIEYEDGEIHHGVTYTDEWRTVERIEYPNGVTEYGLKQRRQQGEYPTSERIEHPDGSVEHNAVFGDGFRHIGQTVFADGDVHHDITVREDGTVTIGRAEIADTPEENVAPAERPKPGELLHPIDSDEGPFAPAPLRAFIATTDHQSAPRY